MRRTVLTVMAATFVLTLAVGTAEAKKGGSSAQDRAFGSGTLAGSGGSFSFDASSDPLGGGATGTFRFDQSAQLILAGDVTCLQVVGNTATIGGVVTEAGPGFESNLGVPITFTVQDNGPDGSGDLISTINPAYEPGDPFCVLIPPNIAIEDGDIVVEDATCERFKEHRDPAKSKCKDKP